MEASKKLAALCFTVVLIIAAISGYYLTRLMTIATIEKITSYSDYNLYEMDVKYAYNLDNLCPTGKVTEQQLINLMLKEAMPLFPIHLEAPNFACSAFSMPTVDGKALMGRSYDFKRDTSSILVYCHPKGGYRSIAFCALDNLKANEADKSLKTRFACLAAPFVCLDGINEKGVSIAVLTLDSAPAKPDTGKPHLMTGLVIRLVLDKAATTEEAVELLKKYDIYSVAGRDYHFYITDASGDGRVVEFDCEDAGRKMVVTSTSVVTNFYIRYIDKLLPNQKNGIYGHGRERYDKIMKVISENRRTLTNLTAWQALRDAAQLPKANDVTSNTQWSIVYNNTDLTAEFVLRRRWNDKIKIKLEAEGVDVDE